MVAMDKDHVNIMILAIAIQLIKEAHANV